MENKLIKDYINNNVPESWENVFTNSKDELEQISDIIENIVIEKGDIVLPSVSNIFNAFYLTPLDKVRVVLIGQDPYHSISNITKTPIAMGLSFSVNDGENIPPSLQNIFKEIKNNMGEEFKIPNTGNLTKWANQGILLLNSCLTVEKGSPGAHCNKYILWLPFIQNVLKEINIVNPKCIFLLWGKDSQKLKKYIGEQSIILEAAHPSPFSVNKGFYGCKHFSKINKILKENPIDWNL